MKISIPCISLALAVCTLSGCIAPDMAVVYPRRRQIIVERPRPVVVVEEGHRRGPVVVVDDRHHRGPAVIVNDRHRGPAVVVQGRNRGPVVVERGGRPHHKVWVQAGWARVEGRRVWVAAHWE